MWAALTALATALAEYLRLKQLTATYDLQCRIESDVESVESEITRLRDRGDDYSARRADRLRARILRAQGVASRLPVSAASAETGSGADGADAGRTVHADSAGGLAQRPVI
jgi:hypothetical protein